MNALYGYPTAGPQVLSGMAHMSQMHGVFDDVGRATAVAAGIISGSTRRELEAAKAENQELGRQIDTMREAVNQMPDGPAKQRAVTLFDSANAAATRQYSAYVDAREKYNAVITEINAHTTGSAMSQMSGLGFWPAFLVAATPYAIVAGVGTALLIGIALAIDVARTSGEFVRGTLRELQGIIREGGGVIHETGDALGKIAWAAVIGVGAFLLYRLVKSGRAERAADVGLAKLESSTALTGPALKPVTGTVL